MSMLHSESVKQGAAATRRISPKNPLEVLARLRDGDTTAGFDLIFKKWRERVESDSDMLTAALLYSYRNYWTTLDRDALKQGLTYEESKAKNAERQERITAESANVAKQIRAVVLLDLTLPSGKSLRESTFKECARAGGWFARVAKLGKPSQIVGEIISEDRLRALKF